MTIYLSRQYSLSVDLIGYAMTIALTIGVVFSLGFGILADKFDKKRYMLNASLKWKVTDWLNITGRVNLDNSDYRNKTEKYASTLATFCSVNGGFELSLIHI